MKVALITIGNELLSGFTVDTNSSWIGQSLIEVGASVSWHLTVKDDPSQIKNALDNIPEDCKTLLITGGLGPTHDDMTRNALFKFVSTSEALDENYCNLLKEKYKKLNIKLPDSNQRQALITTHA